jgi:two-component sensor histidine kinase
VIPDIEPVETQLEQRSGYIEYSWQNSFEPSPQPKALYMEEYEPLGWIVSASSYREEFVQLIDKENLNDLIAVQSSGIDSYSVVVDRSGRFVAHPDYAGHHIGEFFDDSETERLMQAMFSGTEEPLHYSWPVRPRGSPRDKLMFTRYLADFDWAIATTVYLDSLRRPTVIALATGGGILLVAIAVLLFLVLRMSHAVSDPIVRLADAARSNQRLPAVGFSRETPRELMTLIDQFNAFVDRIDAQQREVESQHESVRRSLEEKTVLVREIHHRVKNNLQVIASMLNLQAGSVQASADAFLFEQTAERVISMALVHEQLYQTGDLSVIPFDRYLEDLVDNIRASSGREEIDLQVECEPIELAIERAVPCGLIANELATNALQHAFRHEEAGTITVRMFRRGNTYTLEVADSGGGMPAQVEKSLGMTLVEMLADQIHARLEMSGSGGTRVSVTFPV